MLYLSSTFFIFVFFIVLHNPILWLQYLSLDSCIDSSLIHAISIHHPFRNHPISIQVISSLSQQKNSKYSYPTVAVATSYQLPIHPWTNIASALAGAISCSFTHSVIIPLDVIKTKIQTDISLSNMNTVQVARKLVASSGIGALFDGLSATACGYFLQGACKFGCYDYFKHQISSSLSAYTECNIEKLRLPILLVSSGLAEIVASIALCPLETTKIFLIANSGKYRGLALIRVVNIIIKQEGLGGLYKGLEYILLRQVPYTCAKLTGYELFSSYLKSMVYSYPRDQSVNRKEISNNMLNNMPKNISRQISKQAEAMIQLSSGIVAGILAAIISHPADVLLSRLCSRSSNTVFIVDCIPDQKISKLIDSIRCLGLRGCYAGVVPRALMVGAMTALQFFVYEKVKEIIITSSVVSNQGFVDFVQISRHHDKIQTYTILEKIE